MRTIEGIIKNKIFPGQIKSEFEKYKTKFNMELIVDPDCGFPTDRVNLSIVVRT